MDNYIEVIVANLKKRSPTGPPQSFTPEDLSKLLDKMSKDAGTETWAKPKALQAVTNADPSLVERTYGVSYLVLDFATGMTRLRIPTSNFDFKYGGIPHLLGTIAGDILGYPELESVTIADVKLPADVLAQFPGPQCGINGVRRATGVNDRPLVAFTVKPRLGLTPEQYAAWCGDAAKGGADIVEDDERLVNPRYCPIEKRAQAVLKALKGTPTLYSANLTGNAQYILQMAERLIALGVRMFKVDVLPAGFAALQQLSEFVAGKDIPITVYPGMGSLYRQIGRNVLLQFTRLCGGDIIYAGTPYLGGGLGRHDVNWGGIWESTQRTIGAWNALKSDDSPQLQAAMPTVTTNLHAGNIGLLYYIVKTEGFPSANDFAYFIGGGISSHPNGPREGAAMCRKALDLAIEGKFRLDDFPWKYRRVLQAEFPFFSVHDYQRLKEANT
jgi:ribulose-bisphosphate carboxylase large chain